MRIVVNKYVPFGSFVAMTIGPWIFVKDITKVTPTLINHKSIHWEQEKELLIVPFYLLYVFFFILELFICIFDHQRGTRADGRYRSLWKRAYYSIPFEEEAYDNESNQEYIEHRQHYAWFH